MAEGFRMKPSTKRLIETLIRHAKGMIAAFETWLKDQPTT